MIYILLLSVLLACWAAKVVHSMFFSELRAVPSPLLFQLFPIYYKYILARGHGPFVIHSYYDKYGPVFRVGWATVLFVDMTAATAIYGNYQFSKGVMYEGFNFFGENIISFRMREIHSQRKKLISPAYTRKNLELVEERLREVGVRGLVDGLERAIKEGNSVNIYDLIRFTLWDMTSDISLGSSLGMLQGRNHQVIESVASLLKYGIICAMFPIAKRFIPQCLKDLGLLQKTLIQEYIARREREAKGCVGVRNLDRFYEQMKDGNKLSYEEVYAEAHIMLIAGTDTTTNSLSSFIYLILKHPHVYNKLVKEVCETTQEGEFLTYKEVKNLLYLDAALKEALRLLPVASVPLLRDTPKDGRKICGYFIPGNTEVAVPLYSLHRSDQLWENASQYIPERWIDHTTASPIHHDNFLPFSMGPRGCIGKELAWMQMKLVAANLLRNFHLSLQDPKFDIPYAAIPAFQPIHCKILIHAHPRH